MGFKKRSKVSAEFNMSSLTDIIFLLLIFFMLTSNLATPNLLNLDLPEAESTTPSPQSFGVSINAEGEYFIDEKQIAKAELESRILARMEQERQKEGREPEAINPLTGERDYMTIVLNVDAAVTTGQIVEMLKLADGLKARMILATTPKKVQS